MDLPSSGSGTKPQKPAPRAAWNASGMWVLLVLLMVLMFLWFTGNATAPEVSYDVFRTQLAADNIKQVEFNDHELTGKFKDPPIVKLRQARRQRRHDGREHQAQGRFSGRALAAGRRGFG